MWYYDWDTHVEKKSVIFISLSSVSVLYPMDGLFLNFLSSIYFYQGGMEEQMSGYGLLEIVTKTGHWLVPVAALYFTIILVIKGSNSTGYVDGWSVGKRKEPSS